MSPQDSPELSKIHWNPDNQHLNEQAARQVTKFGWDPDKVRHTLAWVREELRWVREELKWILGSEKKETTPDSVMEAYLARIIADGGYPQAVVYKFSDMLRIKKESQSEYAELLTKIKKQDPGEASKFVAQNEALDIAAMTHIRLMEMGDQALTKKYQRDLEAIVSGETTAA